MQLTPLAPTTLRTIRVVVPVLDLSLAPQAVATARVRRTDSATLSLTLTPQAPTTAVVPVGLASTAVPALAVSVTPQAPTTLLTRVASVPPLVLSLSALSPTARALGGHSGPVRLDLSHMTGGQVRPAPPLSLADIGRSMEVAREALRPVDRESVRRRVRVPKPERVSPKVPHGTIVDTSADDLAALAAGDELVALLRAEDARRQRKMMLLLALYAEEWPEAA